MLSLLDVAERMQKSPKMEENAWNMALFQRMGELVNEYQIAYPDDGSFFNMDDALTDRAFCAALDFLVGNGVYCTSTGRVLRFTEAEVFEAIREMPSEITVGEGKDARIIRKRSIEERQGLNQCPGHHAPWSEEMAPLVVANFARIPSADYLEGFNFAVVDGREVHGMPMEVYAAKRQAAWLREGIRKAGRPGMAIACYPISTKVHALLAPLDREHGLRPTDGILLAMLPDIKVEQDYLAAGIVYGEYGAFKANTGGRGFVGGFVGGVEGAIIEGIVKPIAGFLIYRAAMCTTGLGSVVPSASRIMPAPKFVWGTSVVHQALCHNTGIIRFDGGGGASGPGTETHLLEIAVWSIIAQQNGANLYIVRQGRAQMDAAQTPLEAEWRYEVASAAMRMGLDRTRASDILANLTREFKGRAPEPPVPAGECYDFVRHKPLSAYASVHARVKERLASLGLQV
jgi:methylamine--corrinoid protein Co-methyltransferase